MKLEKEDYLVILGLLITLFINYSFVSTMKQVPSPLYGGDFYNGLGGVIHITDGGNPLESAQMAGEVPWAPTLYHFSIAIFSKVSGINEMMALVDFALIIHLLAYIVVFFLLFKISQNKYAAMLGTILFITTISPIFKYSDFSTILMMPLFLLTFFDFIKTPDKRNLIICGVVLGLASLSNTQAFFDSMLVFGIAFLYFYVLPIFLASKRFSDFKEKENIELLKKYASVFLIGFLISLLFWYGPIFVKHGDTPNDIQNYATPNVKDMNVFLKMSTTLITHLLLPYQRELTWIFSFFLLYGLYCILKTVKNMKLTPPNAENDGTLAPFVYAHRFTLVVLIAWFLAMAHPLITLPLMNTHLIMTMMTERLNVLSVMLIAIGAAKAYDRVQNKTYAQAGMIVLILFATMLYSDHITAMKNDQWMKVGQMELQDYHASLGEWARKNTNVNDVFIATNENGFMLNAISGRKVVSYRRTHASPYINMNQRMIDQAIMLYGLNPQKTEELLKKYNVKYLLISSPTVQENRLAFLEFYFDQNGSLISFFDPLSVPDKKEYEDQLQANGVRYIKQNAAYLDPAYNSDTPRFDLIIAMPQPNFNFENPYSQILMDKFKLVKTITTAQGNAVFKIYQIKES
jgi:hypothetical protein